MKILMASSEMAPLARSGGLGDVLEALPAELKKLGHEVSVALPFYRSIRENSGLEIKSTGVEVTIQVGAKRLDAEIMECVAPNGVQVFLVRRDEYFDRSTLYGAGGRDYDDNAERFIYFTKAVIELAARISPAPEILHVHDWQTALAPVFIRDRGLPFQTVLTIHNLAYQGSFWGVDFALTSLPASYFGPKGVEFYGRLNFLKGGILYADAITTVSEAYAHDIQTVEYGAGLDVVVRENSRRLTGILNGADYSEWDPAIDKHLPKTYTRKAPDGKTACREALLKEMGLLPNPAGPVFTMVTRLAEQKGIDLLLPLLDRLLADDVRLVILGEGDFSYERELMIASRKFRGKFAFKKGFDERSAHLFEAGADCVVIPSHFEPCGLTAMYSLKYGAVPVARATGGIYQVVQDYDPTTGGGNGFLFFDYSTGALWDVIVRARKLFTDKAAWRALVDRAMASDFSWEASVRQYEKVYQSLLRRNGQEKATSLPGSVS